MFKLIQSTNNIKTFNLKDEYKAEESFNYDITIFNHISKTGFTIDLLDISPWVSGITNSSTLYMNDKVEFYNQPTYYINSFNDFNHVFNNYIQLSGINYQFDTSNTIKYTKSIKLGNNYIIAYDDNGGKIKIVNGSGIVITGFTFNNNPVSNINLHSSDGSIVVGYFDTILGKSYLMDITINGTTITKYNPTMFYNGFSRNLNFNSVTDSKIIITYDTDSQGIIQICKKSVDHIFSVGFPFVFNDDFTVFSNSVYQNNNVVVLFYDIDDQLKVKNCRIYDDYIGVGLPTIIKSDYCYDLNIGKLDNNYVYYAIYNSQTIQIELGVLLIDDDITIVDSEISIDDWNEGLNLTTINDRQFMISYMDSGYTGVYRLIDMSGGTFDDILVEYNLFDIDLTNININKNIGYNDYWITYNNVIIEKGVCYIEPTPLTYNI